MGARFRGRNKKGLIRWSRVCEIVTAEPGLEFAYRTVPERADLVLVFVLKKNLPQGGAQAAALAKALDHWAHEQPDPYLGHHWPQL